MTTFILCLIFSVFLWGLYKALTFKTKEPMTRMNIWIGFNRVKAEVVEWADIRRIKPIAFFATCPSCRCRQWAKVDYLYRAADGTKRNLRCKKCGVGKPKPGDWQRREVDPYKSFSPKNTGWKSITSNRATPSTADKSLDTD